LVGFGFRPEWQQFYTLQRDTQAGRKRLVLYRPTSWEPEFEYTTDYSEALAAAFSSDGRLLAIPLADTRIEVWDLEALNKSKRPAPFDRN
jgi:WD40 repeat protein